MGKCVNGCTSCCTGDTIQCTMHTINGCTFYTDLQTETFGTNTHLLFNLAQNQVMKIAKMN